MTTPLYLEVKAAMELEILSGRIPPGQKLPTMRVLSERYRINGNTVQRALAGLRETGLVTGGRRETMRVTSDTVRITFHRQEKATTLIRKCIRQLRELGYTSEEIKSLIYIGV